MASADDEPRVPPEPTAADELARMPYEPLLPVEIKLIAGSLILGVVLLGLLVWLTR